MPRLHIPDLPWEEQRSPAGRYHSFCRNLSVALGGLRHGGTSAGGHPFDVQIRRIPPGAAVCPFHSHLAQWELFVVRAGHGTVRAGDERHAVAVGDVFVHPPGAAHQLVNSGATDLEVLIVADNPPLDGCYYPDSGKWALRPPGKVFRMEETGYFDGEETPPPDAKPHRITGAPPAASPTPFRTRLIRPDALPWATWESPRRRFRGAGKELSLALGAQRNTPTGLGGHPFDLELDRLEPGVSGCPFHSHAAQWELFLILEGRAVVRAGAETFGVTAGDVILHPPGEPHQITAGAEDPVTFLLIADNPPVDYWHYPDSNKWGLRAPRQFFRVDPLDYWAGEE
jgi:uncharacterized cupin superfamily protein